MYLGLLLILSGEALALRHPFPFVVLPAYVGYMNRFQIGPEERALTGIFGQAYVDYRQRVRRWL
jgi:protein-S-isoprenylcysteine O-methyltransferase Ste14